MLSDQIRSSSNKCLQSHQNEGLFENQKITHPVEIRYSRHLVLNRLKICEAELCETDTTLQDVADIIRGSDSFYQS